MANRSPEQNDAVNKVIVNMCTGVSKLNLNKRSNCKSKGSFSKCYPLGYILLFTILLACDKACAVNLMSDEDLGVSAYHSELFLPFNGNFLGNR